MKKRKENEGVSEPGSKTHYKTFFGFDFVLRFGGIEFPDWNGDDVDDSRWGLGIEGIKRTHSERNTVVAR